MSGRDLHFILTEPQRKKTGIQGFRLGATQIGQFKVTEVGYRLDTLAISRRDIVLS